MFYKKSFFAILLHVLFASTILGAPIAVDREASAPGPRASKIEAREETCLDEVRGLLSKRDSPEAARRDAASTDTGAGCKVNLLLGTPEGASRDQTVKSDVPESNRYKMSLSILSMFGLGNLSLGANKDFKVESGDGPKRATLYVPDPDTLIQKGNGFDQLPEEKQKMYEQFAEKSNNAIETIRKWAEVLIGGPIDVVKHPADKKFLIEVRENIVFINGKPQCGFCRDPLKENAR